MTLFYGHQPRIVYDKILSKQSPYQITDPEVSQAFYGELNGSPEYFMIKSPTEFNLYLQLLKPDFEKRTFSAEVYKDGKPFTIMNGKEHEWTLFYEEYGGDTYYKGPEFEKRVPSGTYTIKVYSPDNLGKYSLAVGKLEKFDTKESINALITLPQLKIQYWNKSLFSIFEGRIGKFILSFVLCILVIIMIVLFFLLR